MSDSKNGMPAEKNDQVEKNDDQQYSLNDDRRVKVLSPGASSPSASSATAWPSWASSSSW